MEIGSVVRFSSDPRSFVMEDEYCDNPDCTCNAVWLRFTAIDHPEAPRTKPLSFRIHVDLETWQEIDPPTRESRIGQWVEEFLSQFSESRKNEFQNKHLAGRRHAQRIAEYRIDPQEIHTGVLVSFSDILTAGKSLSSGGNGYVHRFTNNGCEYFVEDMYCPNPACDCQAFHVQFWQRMYMPEKEKHVITRSFLGRVSFNGKLEIENTEQITQREARQILSAWQKAFRYDKDLFEHRYQRVKDIGRRSLENAETGKAGHPAAEKEHRLRRNEAASSSGLSPRVGRNAPCPCGSGKKFKRCCAAPDARPPLAKRSHSLA